MSSRPTGAPMLDISAASARITHPVSLNRPDVQRSYVTFNVIRYTPRPHHSLVQNDSP